MIFSFSFRILSIFLSFPLLFINIKIELTEDNHLHFCCSNSKVLQGEDLHGGVGLQNVKRRLELIYGKDYTLDIKDEEKTYTVNLTLPL